MRDRRRFVPALLALLLLALAGCAPEGSGPTCTVVFEDDQDLFFYRQVYEVPRGGDVEVEVGVPAGERIINVTYKGEPLADDDGQFLVFEKIARAVADGGVQV